MHRHSISHLLATIKQGSSLGDPTLADMYITVRLTTSEEPKAMRHLSFQALRCMGQMLQEAGAPQNDFCRLIASELSTCEEGVLT